MSRGVGWKLDLGDGMKVVIGARELVRVFHEPDSFSIPCTPYYCHRVMFWEHGLLPLFDLGDWFLKYDRENTPEVVCAVGYMVPGATRPGFGAFMVAVPPERVEVDDAWACDLPPSHERWRRVSCACFRLGEEILPVLDLGALFTRSPEAIL